MLRMKRASGATLSNNPNQSDTVRELPERSSTPRLGVTCSQTNSTRHIIRPFTTRGEYGQHDTCPPLACLSGWGCVHSQLRPFTAGAASSCPAPHNSGGARACRPLFFVPASAPRVCVALRARRGRHRARRRPPPSPAGWPPARRASRATCPNGSRPRGRHCLGSYDPRECLAIPP